MRLLILIGLGAPAFADEAQSWKPSKIIVCEEIQSANPALIARDVRNIGEVFSPFSSFARCLHGEFELKKETCHKVR